MASLIRITAQNLIKSRSVVAPVIARSFAFRKLEIDPVCVLMNETNVIAC